ncbi:MAG TPA: hypothetical protein VEH31_20065, partial [Streptosporangiaceae bacterium]|nr:hypothetical protein [Streptosporangiaceae bacterium]
DDHGFVVTGSDLSGQVRRRPPWEKLGRDPYLLETSLPGVFAAGDVRRASVKRCASAVGEGAVSIPQVHAWLETLTVAQAGPGH